MIELTLFAAIVTLALVVRSLYKYFTADSSKRIAGKKATLHDAGVEYPGHMAFATKGGEYFHGCRVARFTNIQELNNFFLPNNAGHLGLVAELIPQANGDIVCVYTKKLSLEELEDIDEWNRNQHEYFQKKKTDREIAKQEEQRAKLQAEAEEKEFAAIGRKYMKRMAHIKKLDPSSIERKQLTEKTNKGELDE